MDVSGGRALDVRGQGDALDANLSTRGRSNRAVPQQDFRARNLVVTKDVGDGRGFRGSIGYRAADDFQGSLGSETLSSFRSYSASSDPLLFQSLAGSGRYDTAQGVNMLEYRRGFGLGPAGAVSTELAAHSVRGPDNAMLLVARQALNRRVDADSSASILQFDGRPRVMQELATASLVLNPVSGWHAVEPRYTELTRYLSPYDLARLRYLERTLSTTGVIQPFNSRLRKKVESASLATVQSERSTTLAPESYWRASDSIEGRLKARGEVDLPLSMERIRRQLGDAELWQQDLIDARLNPYRDLGRKVDPGDPAAAGVEAEDAWDPHAAAEVLRHAESLSTLVPQTDGRATTLLRAGQEALQDGRYTSASRLFESATLLSPNNPLAKAGRAVSDLAGGLPSTAGLRLRVLFVSHPEMIAMRLDPSLLPTERRLRDVGGTALQLGARAPIGEKVDLGLAAAFCGFQLSDTALTRAGLDLMAEDPSSGDLTTVLRDIWLAPAN